MTLLVLSATGPMRRSALRWRTSVAKTLIPRRTLMALLVLNALWVPALLWSPAALSAPASGSGEAAPALTPAMRTMAQQLMRSALEGDDAAYGLVASLTTEIGPRQAGTEAEARARQWAVTRLEGMGLHHVKIESFKVPRWQRGEERAEILAPFPQPLVITTLGGSIGTGPEGIEAEVVAFGSLAGLQSAPEGMVQGKIVFIDEVMTRTQDGSGYATAGAKRRQSAYEAQRQGARAVLIRSVGTSSHRFAHTGQMRRVGQPGEEGVPAAALAAPDADQLRRILAQGQPVTVRLVLTPRLLPGTDSGNVIAEIPGRAEADEIVLAGAHLDSWDLGTGAVDDGAGVAIVMAAARLLLNQLAEPPRRTIRVVLFGSEEVGLVGARAYAERHAAELPGHIIAVESDFGAGDIWRFDSAVAEDKIPAAMAIGELLRPLGIGPGGNNARGGPDLLYLREAGVPVADLKQNGWDYFDLHHTANDTLDKIAPGGLRQNVAAYAVFLYLAAESGLTFR